jgi:hypothetical protein
VISPELSVLETVIKKVGLVDREVAKKCLGGYKEEEEKYVLRVNRREA